MDIPELVRREALRRGLSHRTIKTYRQCLKQFFLWFKGDPRYVRKKDVKDYLYMLVEKERSGSCLNVHLCAIKFLYEKVLHRKMTVNISYSKTPKALPTVLTKTEVKRLLDAISNPRQKLMISLMYSAGLRLSELIKLRIRDIEDGFGWVRKGKGSKDRMFIVAEKIKEQLTFHIANNSKYWLFTGTKGRHYSTRSIGVIIKKAAIRAGIKKNVHPHTLRHSFATHLIENGYPVTVVQNLLGHNSSETTMVYVHMAPINLKNVKSPLDLL